MPTIQDLYQGILGRAPDPEGLSYWQQYMGDTVDPNEIDAFKAAAQPELAARPAPATGFGTPAPVTNTSSHLAFGTAGGPDPLSTGLAAVQSDPNAFLQTIGNTPITYQQGNYGGYAVPSATGSAQPTQDYLRENPDVWGEFLGSSDGLSAEDFAARHYNVYGRAENRNGTGLPDWSSAYENLYQSVLDRAADPSGLQYWMNQFGGDISEEERQKFIQAAQPELNVKSTARSIFEDQQITPDELRQFGTAARALNASDEDLAKTIGVTTDFASRLNTQSGLLNFTDLLSGPDISTQNVQSAYDYLRGRSNLTDEQKTALDNFGTKLTAAKDRWSGWGVDPLQAETLYQQLGAINNAAGGQNWQGTWMSGGDNAMHHAVQRLQQRGVDNLADLQVRPNFVESTAAELYNGVPVQVDSSGRRYIMRSSGSDETYSVSPEYLPENAQTEFRAVDADADGISYYRPLTEQERQTFNPQTGRFNVASGYQLVDGSSGRVVASGSDTNNFVLDQYETGNFFKSKTKTFGVRMTPDGVPVPYIDMQRDGLLYSPILPIALSLFGVPALIGQGLAATGVGALAQGTLLNTALSQGIMSGLTSSLRGGDFGDAFLSGALSGGISSGVGSLLPSDLDPNIAKAISSTAGRVASTALSGGDIEQALTGGILSGLTSYGMGALRDAATSSTTSPSTSKTAEADTGDLSTVADLSEKLGDSVVPALLENAIAGPAFAVDNTVQVPDFSDIDALAQAPTNWGAGDASAADVNVLPSDGATTAGTEGTNMGDFDFGDYSFDVSPEAFYGFDPGSLGGLDLGGLDLDALAALGDIGGFSDVGGLDLGGLDLDALAALGDIGGSPNVSDLGGLDLDALAALGDVGGFPDSGNSGGGLDLDALAALGDVGGFPDAGTTTGSGLFTDDTEPGSSGGTQGSQGPAAGAFTDDTEPGSSGGTQGSQGPAGAGSTGSYSGASYTPGGATVDSNNVTRLPDGTRVTSGGSVIRPNGTVVRPDGTTTRLSPDALRRLLSGTGTSGQQNLIGTLLPLLIAAMAMRDRGGSQASSATIPALSASRSQTPYTQAQQTPGYRPGQGGVRYFDQMQYGPRMAGGGIVDLANALAARRMAAGGSAQRKGLLQGRGDGVSDSIPAMIGKDQPARLARGEYVVDARTVAELGNGSTDAGAERLDEMRKRVHSKRKGAKVGQDTKAYKALPA